MLRKLVLPAVAAFMLLGASAARAQFQAQDWELTLGGTGANSSDFDGTTFNVQGNLGYFLTDQFEVSLRQSIGYTDFVGADGGGSAWSGATRVAADYHFDLDRWQPYIGAQIGYAYGDLFDDTWIAGPEGGVKYFVNSTTFIQFSVEYQFFFDNAGGADDAFDDGQFVYGLNIGFRWR